ncbi:MAG TPA: hypothetical protein VFI23_00535 [Rhizomicrobium sp.]|nr:hypothetical protein [Rhizomicrobium sp.]
MAIATDASVETAFAPDRLSGTSRVHVIDRWIYVFTAASLLAIVLAGFVPDSLTKIAAVQAGERPPFPLILHVHATLMGSFILLLLGQTVLMATGRRNWHMRLGIAAVVLVPAIVISGIILVPTMYHAVWNAAQAAPAAAKQPLQLRLQGMDDILLLQLRAALLFPLFMWIALRARTRDAGLHKRMVFLAVTTVLAAAIDRLVWLPNTMPNSALAPDLYTLLAFTPMLIWDLIRNRGLHRAYLIWAAFFLPLDALIYTVWNTPFWHAAARQLMGV